MMVLLINSDYFRTDIFLTSENHRIQFRDPGLPDLPSDAFASSGISLLRPLSDQEYFSKAVPRTPFSKHSLALFRQSGKGRKGRTKVALRSQCSPNAPNADCLHNASDIGLRIARKTTSSPTRVRWNLKASFAMWLATQLSPGSNLTLHRYTNAAIRDVCSAKLASGRCPLGTPSNRFAGMHHEPVHHHTKHRNVHRTFLCFSWRFTMSPAPAPRQRTATRFFGFSRHTQRKECVICVDATM